MYDADIHPRRIDIEVMQEMEIDMSCHYSKSVEEFTDKEFDYVITVCDGVK